ncbi:MAG: DNA primase [Actinomycetaceae bacterium]
MSTDPRAALDRLVAALEEHHLAAQSAQDPDSPRVVAAATTIEEVFVTYDDALFTAYGVDLPFDLYDDEDDDDYDDDDDIDDEEYEDLDDDENGHDD